MKMIFAVLYLLLATGVSASEEADVVLVRAVLASSTSSTVILCVDRAVESGRYDLHFRLGDPRAVSLYFPLTLSGGRERQMFEQDGYLKVPCRILPIASQSFVLRPVQTRHVDRLQHFSRALSGAMETGESFGFELSNAREIEAFSTP